MEAAQQRRGLFRGLNSKERAVTTSLYIAGVAASIAVARQQWLVQAQVDAPIVCFILKWTPISAALVTSTGFWMRAIQRNNLVDRRLERLAQDVPFDEEDWDWPLWRDLVPAELVLYDGHLHTRLTALLSHPNFNFDGDDYLATFLNRLSDDEQGQLRTTLTQQEVRLLYERDGFLDERHPIYRLFAGATLEQQQQFALWVRDEDRHRFYWDRRDILEQGGPITDQMWNEPRWLLLSARDLSEMLDHCGSSPTTQLSLVAGYPRYAAEQRIARMRGVERGHSRPDLVRALGQLPPTQLESLFCLKEEHELEGWEELFILAEAGGTADLQLQLAQLRDKERPHAASPLFQLRSAIGDKTQRLQPLVQRIHSDQRLRCGYGYLLRRPAAEVGELLSGLSCEMLEEIHNVCSLERWSRSGSQRFGYLAHILANKTPPATAVTEFGEDDYPLLVRAEAGRDLLWEGAISGEIDPDSEILTTHLETILQESRTEKILRLCAEAKADQDSAGHRLLSHCLGEGVISFSAPQVQAQWGDWRSLFYKLPDQRMKGALGQLTQEQRMQLPLSYAPRAPFWKEKIAPTIAFDLRTVQLEQGNVDWQLPEWSMCQPDELVRHAATAPYATVLTAVLTAPESGEGWDRASVDALEAKGEEGAQELFEALDSLEDEKIQRLYWLKERVPSLLIELQFARWLEAEPHPLLSHLEAERVKKPFHVDHPPAYWVARRMCETKENHEPVIEWISRHIPEQGGGRALCYWYASRSPHFADHLKGSTPESILDVHRASRRYPSIRGALNRVYESLAPDVKAIVWEVNQAKPGSAKVVGRIALRRFVNDPDFFRALIAYEPSRKRLKQWIKQERNQTLRIRCAELSVGPHLFDVLAVLDRRDLEKLPPGLIVDALAVHCGFKEGQSTRFRRLALLKPCEQSKVPLSSRSYLTWRVLKEMIWKLPSYLGLHSDLTFVVGRQQIDSNRQLLAGLRGVVGDLARLHLRDQRHYTSPAAASANSSSAIALSSSSSALPLPYPELSKATLAFIHQEQTRRVHGSPPPQLSSEQQHQLSRAVRAPIEELLVDEIVDELMHLLADMGKSSSTLVGEEISALLEEDPSSGLIPQEIRQRFVGMEGNHHLERLRELLFSDTIHGKLAPELQQELTAIRGDWREAERAAELALTYSLPPDVATIIGKELAPLTAPLADDLAKRLTRAPWSDELPAELKMRLARMRPRGKASVGEQMRRLLFSSEVWPGLPPLLQHRLCAIRSEALQRAADQMPRAVGNQMVCALTPANETRQVDQLLKRYAEQISSELGDLVESARRTEERRTSREMVERVQGDPRMKALLDQECAESIDDLASRIDQLLASRPIELSPILRAELEEIKKEGATRAYQRIYELLLNQPEEAIPPQLRGELIDLKKRAPADAREQIGSILEELSVDQVALLEEIEKEEAARVAMLMFSAAWPRELRTLLGPIVQAPAAFLARKIRGSLPINPWSKEVPQAVREQLIGELKDPKGAFIEEMKRSMASSFCRGQIPGHQKRIQEKRAGASERMKRLIDDAVWSEPIRAAFLRARENQQLRNFLTEEHETRRTKWANQLQERFKELPIEELPHKVEEELEKMESAFEQEIIGSIQMLQASDSREWIRREIERWVKKLETQGIGELLTQLPVERQIRAARALLDERQLSALKEQLRAMPREAGSAMQLEVERLFSSLPLERVGDAQREIKIKLTHFSRLAAAEPQRAPTSYDYFMALLFDVDLDRLTEDLLYLADNPVCPVSKTVLSQLLDKGQVAALCAELSSQSEGVRKGVALQTMELLTTSVRKGKASQSGRLEQRRRAARWHVQGHLRGVLRNAGNRVDDLFVGDLRNYLKRKIEQRLKTELEAFAQARFGDDQEQKERIVREASRQATQKIDLWLRSFFDSWLINKETTALRNRVRQSEEVWQELEQMGALAKLRGERHFLTIPDYIVSEEFRQSEGDWTFKYEGGQELSIPSPLVFFSLPPERFDQLMAQTGETLNEEVYPLHKALFYFLRNFDFEKDTPLSWALEVVEWLKEGYLYELAQLAVFEQISSPEQMVEVASYPTTSRAYTVKTLTSYNLPSLIDYLRRNWQSDQSTASSSTAAASSSSESCAHETFIRETLLPLLTSLISEEEPAPQAAASSSRPSSAGR